MNPDAMEDELILCVDDEIMSLSSDETWTPSIEGEDSDDDDLDDDDSRGKRLQFNSRTSPLHSIRLILT